MMSGSAAEENGVLGARSFGFDLRDVVLVSEENENCGDVVLASNCLLDRVHARDLGCVTLERRVHHVPADEIGSRGVPPNAR